MPQIAYESEKCKKWVSKNLHKSSIKGMLNDFTVFTDNDRFNNEVKILKQAGFKEGIDFSFRKIW